MDCVVALGCQQFDCWFEIKRFRKDVSAIYYIETDTIFLCVENLKVFWFFVGTHTFHVTFFFYLNFCHKKKLIWSIPSIGESRKSFEKLLNNPVIRFRSPHIRL